MSITSMIADLSRRSRPGPPPAPESAGTAPPTATGALREEILAGGLDAARARALADGLEAEGDLLAALDALMVANRLGRDPALERRLVRLRRAAYARLDFALAPLEWPHFALGPAVGSSDRPLEIPAADFDAEMLKIGVLRHGHLLVRGLIPRRRAARLREAVDRAFAARDLFDAGAATAASAPWYDPLEDVRDGDIHRAVARTASGVLAADAPRALFEYVETVHELQLDRILTAYFGERPALSVRKCTLRRVDTPVKIAGWHQDGAFLGTTIRTVNAWMALSRCGRDAPGIEVIPCRLDRLIPQLADGSPYAWTVPPEHIARELPGVEVWKPEFEPGDVLFFDQFSLHRTAVFEAEPRPRHAIEGWFFAPSRYANDPSELLVV